MVTHFLQVQQAQPQHPSAGTENPRPGRERQLPGSEHGAAAGETVRLACVPVKKKTEW